MKLYLIAVLLTAARSAAASRCDEVQNTLMTCVTSNTPDPSNMHDIAAMCQTIHSFSECISVARNACPNLPIFSDPGFVSSSRMMVEEGGKYCQTEEGSSCDEVERTLMDCVMSHTPDQQDSVADMCQKVRGMSECIAVARDACPSLAVFSEDHGLVSGVALMEQQIASACPTGTGTTSTPEPTRGAPTSPPPTDCALADLEECLNYMPAENMSPADACSQTELYVSCLESVLDRCADKVDTLPTAELRENIDIIRSKISVACPTTSVEPQSCEVLAAMTSCNNHLEGISPGDLDAMCSDGKGSDYIACLENVVSTCANDLHTLPFDLPEAIQSTKSLLQTGCPDNVRPTPVQDCTNAKRSCADHLTDGHGGDYCHGLELYKICIFDLTRDCPDKRLQTMTVNQYYQHCKEKCPHETQSAVSECERYLNRVKPGDSRRVYCRKANKYVHCMENLISRCENHSRRWSISTIQMDDIKNTC